MAEFKSDRQPMLQSSNPEAAHTYLQEKYLRAQECAMKTLADMAVTGLEAAVQQRLQDSLIQMVTPTVVSLCYLLLLINRAFLH